jgi:hypothetical protein
MVYILEKPTYTSSILVKTRFACFTSTLACLFYKYFALHLVWASWANISLTVSKCTYKTIKSQFRNVVEA